MKELKLKAGKLYDVTVHTKTGGKKKNRSLNFEQRATFAGTDGDFAKFVVTPVGFKLNPVLWQVRKEFLVKAKIAKGKVKEKE